MDEKRKRAILLGVAFLLPLIFIMVVFITSYVPSQSLSTEFNFVYATCSEGRSPYSYYCSSHLQNRFSIENGRVIENDLPADLDSDNDGVADRDENYSVRLFVHDTTLDQSEEISLVEAQRLSVDAKMTSPDGVAVEWQFASGGNFFPFARYSSRYGYFLTRGGAKRELNLVNESQVAYYQNDFRFLGWVIER